MAPFLAASAITFYLVGQMQELGVRCTSYQPIFHSQDSRPLSGNLREGPKEPIRCSNCEGGGVTPLARSYTHLVARWSLARN